jgi:hypothetical protein
LAGERDDKIGAQLTAIIAVNDRLTREDERHSAMDSFTHC